MSLLRWETLFFLSDEVFHMVRAASDLGVVMDACVYGIPSMTALVRVMASLFLVAFHALYLGFYTSGITVSIRVQLVNGPGANDAPVPVPPPMPPVPNPEAVAMAIAAARAVDAAAGRLDSQHRGSAASSPRGGSPRFGSGSPRRNSSRSSSRRDSTVEQEALVTSFSEPRRLPPEDSGAEEMFGSVTQTLSGASTSGSSKTAIVPYVERPLIPRNDAPGQPEQSPVVQQARTSNPSGAAVCLVGVDVQPATASSEPAANEARGTSAPGAAESLTRGEIKGHVQSPASPGVAPGSVDGASAGPATANDRLQSPATEEDFESASRAAARDSATTMTYCSSELVVDLAESSVKCPTLGNKAGTSPTLAKVSSLPGPSCSRGQDMAKKSESSREQSAKQSPSTSRKSSSPSATPFKSPTGIQGPSSLGSPSGYAQAIEEPQRSPKESQSAKQSPTTSRKSSGSDNLFKSPIGAQCSSRGSPSGRVQEPVERPERCREQSAKHSSAASLKPSAPATPSESPE